MTSIDLQVLTDEDLDAQGLSLEEAWMVRFGEELHGPFAADALKQYAAAHPEVFAQAEATALHREQWAPLSEMSPPPKRRRPQLVPASTLQPPTQLHVLKNGQSMGPYETVYVLGLLERGELVFSDLVSIDAGATWQKAWEVKVLQARRHSAQELPRSPSEQSLSHGYEEAMEAAEHEPPTIKQGLASLAYLGQRKSNPTPSPLNDLYPPSHAQGAGREISPKVWVAGLGGGAMAVLMAMVVWIGQRPSPEGEAMELAGADVEMTTPSPSRRSPAAASAPKVRAQRESPARIQRAPASVHPARVPSPPSMVDRREELTSYHDDPPRDEESPVEPVEMDDRYPQDDTQVAERPAENSLVRRPSSGGPAEGVDERDERTEHTEEPAEDHVEVAPPENVEAPVVEEVGDF